MTVSFACVRGCRGRDASLIITKSYEASLFTYLLKKLRHSFLFDIKLSGDVHTVSSDMFYTFLFLLLSECEIDSVEIS